MEPTGWTASASGASANGLPPDIIDRIRRIQLVAFDFDGVFTDNTVWVSEDGVESVRCWRGDGLGLRMLEQLGLNVVIISTETNDVVAARSRKLAVRCVHGCNDKRAALGAIMQEIGITVEQIAYVGNDINDLECLQIAGIPIVVQDAHPSVLPHAAIRTRARGGRGAVREVCDLFDSILRV